MSMEMAMVCPKCEHEGPHPIMAYDIMDLTPIFYQLHCNKCEHVWKEWMKEEWRPI